MQSHRARLKSNNNCLPYKTKGKSRWIEGVEKQGLK
jgi:hypothetical protein